MLRDVAYVSIQYIYVCTVGIHTILCTKLHSRYGAPSQAGQSNHSLYYEIGTLAVRPPYSITLGSSLYCHYT